MAGWSVQYAWGQTPAPGMLLCSKLDDSAVLGKTRQVATFKCNIDDGNLA